MKKYDIIYADPPWHYFNKAKQNAGNKGKFVHINDRYKTMSIDELKYFFENKVSNISEKDCALFMWTTDCYLPIAIELGKQAGFIYKTIAFVWVKKHKTGGQVYNMGMWTMKNAEIVLLFIKGKMHSKLKRRNIRQLIEAVRSKNHSEKPEEVRESINLMFDLNLKKIELFARKETVGWDVFGNEVSNSIDI